MESRFLKFVAASAVFMTVLLLLDADGLPRQLALGTATALFLWYFARSSEVRSGQIICCIIVATIGEVVLSLGWGLYSYRHAIIPFYVPPGHGLFYTLAAETARQQAVCARHRHYAWTLVSGTAIAANLGLRHDVWGFVLLFGATALIAISKNRLLLSACFIYTLILEWLVTAIGNWTSAAEVPFLRLHSANPPVGVGGSLHPDQSDRRRHCEHNSAVERNRDGHCESVSVVCGARTPVRQGRFSCAVAGPSATQQRTKVAWFG